MLTLVDRLIEEEGLTTWLYLDSANPPVVTCGVGHALFALENALVLPWNQPPAGVQWDYNAVQTAPPNYKAAWYSNLTKSRLTPKYVRQLLEADIEAATVATKKYLPDFDSYPESAQAAIQDLSFNLGPGWPVNGKWPKLTAAVKSQDWLAASLNCHRKGISEDRNKATADLFREAAGVVEAA